MPLPKPKDDEKEDAFIGRCMADSTMKREYDDNDQRLAVCNSQWREGKKAMNPNDLLIRAIEARGVKAEPFAHGIHKADVYVRTLQDRIGLDRCYRYAAKGVTSFNDVMEKAAKTLTYSNPEMLVEKKGDEVGLPEGIELPKNCLMVFRHVLTTNRKDRDGDILHTDGMEVDQNMLMLFQHVHTLPIGKMLAEVDHTKSSLTLVSCIVDINELCHDSAVMIDNEMGRFSHGFRAIEFDEIKAEKADAPSGFEIKKGEIMEQSLVSVPANIDATTEEVMLSLVEGGKLTSPLMKEVGKGIRERQPAMVPVNLDLKVTVNGREVENEDEPRGGNEKGAGEGSSGASKEADAGLEETKETADKEVTGEKVYAEVSDSFEWIRSELQSQVRVLFSSADNEYAYIEATFANYVLVQWETSNDHKYYEIPWEMKEGKPTLTGDKSEVQVKVGVLKSYGGEKRGRVLSKANEASIEDAKEDVDEASKSEGLTRGTKALLREASGKLGTVLKSLASDKPEVDAPKEGHTTVKDAMSMILLEGTSNERKQMVKLLFAAEEQEKKNKRLEQFRKFKRN